MTRSMRQRTGTARMCIGAILSVWLTASAAHAGTVTIAVTPSVIDAVDTVAQAFEAAHVGDRVRIVVNSEADLKSSIKSLPVQVVVSDDSSLIEWMEAQDFARRPAMAPTVSVPLTVVASSVDAAVFGSTGDLLDRMKQQGTIIAIPDPPKIDCGRRAQALLKTVGLSVEPYERLVFAPDAMTTKGVTIHAVSVPGAFSSVDAFALKRGQQDHPVAQRFLALVNTSQGQQALKVKGYELVQASQLGEAAAIGVSIALPSISR